MDYSEANTGHSSPDDFFVSLNKHKVARVPRVLHEGKAEHLERMQHPH